MDINLRLPFRGTKRAGELASPGISNDQAQYIAPYTGFQYLEAAKRGRVFHGDSAAAGSVIPIYSNTAQVFGLWNPLGSNINVVPIRLGLTFVSTTGAAGGWVLGYTAGTSAGLAAPITAFTDGVVGTTIFNALLGGGAVPRARFTPSAATVSAPIRLLDLGINQLVTTAATTGAVPWTADYQFNGSLVVAPGSAIWLAGNIATLSLYASTLSWMEEDI